MTSTISDMMETYPAEINTDRELLAQCVDAQHRAGQGPKAPRVAHRHRQRTTLNAGHRCLNDR